MNEGLISTPLDALRGRVSGVSIPVGGNSAAALAAVRVRGTTSLTGGNDPLVIIDGVFADLNLLSSIYPADIENFTILKDASETAQYGSRGASGVIEVTTKKGRQGALVSVMMGVSVWRRLIKVWICYRRMVSGNWRRNVISVF